MTLDSQTPAAKVFRRPRVLARSRPGLNPEIIPVESLANLTYLRCVNRWKAIIALLLALCYLPATAHCLWEQTGVLGESDGCCERSAATKDSAPASPACVSGCCILERDQYASPSRDLIVLSFPVALLNSLVPVALAEIPPARILPPDTSPPELPQAWQFSRRTALPPRAPTVVS